MNIGEIPYVKQDTPKVEDPPKVEVAPVEPVEQESKELVHALPPLEQRIAMLKAHVAELEAQRDKAPSLVPPEFHEKLENARKLRGIVGTPSPFELAVQDMWNDVKAVEAELGPTSPKAEEMRRRLNIVINHS